eukprot:5085773-Pyramimonas_sp.AAC.1
MLEVGLTGSGLSAILRGLQFITLVLGAGRAWLLYCVTASAAITSHTGSTVHSTTISQSSST